MATREIKIRKVEFQYWHTSKRRIKVWFSGKYPDNYAYISPCYDGYEIWHATRNQAVACGPIVEKYLDWLHGA